MPNMQIDLQYFFRCVYAASPVFPQPKEVVVAKQHSGSLWQGQSVGRLWPELCHVSRAWLLDRNSCQDLVSRCRKSWVSKELGVGRIGLRS